ncbi:[NiFe]-hydrogenase assembly chaperone HybE [Halomonas sp. ANAO-440]|uniref:[NiFe]-hydrogenase assembly chaperone HybE n=1 Tax=Halomonas sp. ANAO-440 TaxID=2861360 RepID=UPI001CAA441C|nr:[NiFe]-hydrogenase assembly chaperone HybE [Halomonas sp. ANAO-440]MBZ0330324.1 [NiFe]-hydrogenase assembly chaperone HybE [Halomonas sp. ANAO-440]
MQALTPEQYERLRDLAAAWQQQQGRSLKASPQYNPRLTVDALCFQVLPEDPSDGEDTAYLAGALVTPVSLSLVLVPAEHSSPPPEPGTRRHFTLPSGRYPFIAERPATSVWLWRCELIDDLSDLDSLQEASRLAQRMMDKVMSVDGKA